jgi:hypothetical protein
MLSDSLRRVAWLAALALQGCGGSQAASQPVHPAAAKPGHVIVDAPQPEPEPEPAKPAQPGLPPGANGPADAAGMIGDAGRVVEGQPESVVLVNSAQIRTHPWADALTRALTGVLVGWNQFMPTDLVDPIHDVDWMLLAGTLVMGSTQRAVILARYDFPEQRADVVSTSLLSRMPNARRLPLGARLPISATVDGTERAFLRPQPGLLAIVPVENGKKTWEALQGVAVPASVRPGELLRLSLVGRPRQLAALIPPEVGALRAWITPENAQEIALHVEGDCRDEAAAERATAAVRQQLDEAAARPELRLAVGGVLERSTAWQDGKTVRWRTTLQERDVRAAAWVVMIALRW